MTPSHASVVTCKWATLYSVTPSRVTFVKASFCSVLRWCMNILQIKIRSIPFMLSYSWSGWMASLNMNGCWNGREEQCMNHCVKFWVDIFSTWFNLCICLKYFCGSSSFCCFVSQQKAFEASQDESFELLCSLDMLIQKSLGSVHPCWHLGCWLSLSPPCNLGRGFAYSDLCSFIWLLFLYFSNVICCYLWGPFWFFHNHSSCHSIFCSGTVTKVKRSSHN